MTMKQASALLQSTEDGLEKAMKNLRLRSLPEKDLVLLAKYAIRNDTIKIEDIEEIKEAQDMIYNIEPRGLHDND